MTRKLKELCRYEVFNPGQGTFYVVMSKDENDPYPIIRWCEDSKHHWNEFPDEVKVIGMLFLVPDKD